MNTENCLFVGLAFLISLIVYPITVRLACRYSVFDRPNQRKLQQNPVPVLGGIPIAFGMIVPMLIAAVCGWSDGMYQLIIAIVVLNLIGTIDDVRDIPAWIRFVLEMLVIWVLIWRPNQPDNGFMIDCLNGLWGRQDISVYTALPLTIFAGVGIVNAINMIDGVDGYSSGYGMITCALFAMIFSYLGMEQQALISSISVAACVPFYLHNVFGKRSKMFMGDGGSLVLGMIMTYGIFSLLSIQSPAVHLQEHGIGVVALALAILCVPVFDTLRVMCARVICKRSPFSADMTHLHHIYIRLGFSHVGTSTCIILTNLLIVGLWFLSWRLGASINAQFYLVVALGLLATCGFYYGAEYSITRQNGFYRVMNAVGRWTHFEEKGVWLFLQKVVDRF